MKWTVDTNLLIEATRDPGFNRELQGWFRLRGPHLFMHATVLLEFLVGARDSETRLRWRSRWQVPAERVGRMISPSPASWDLASEAVVRLRENRSLTTVAPAFLNDCLIAASCRQEGLTLVTRNASDFERIADVLPGFRFEVSLG